MISVLPKYVESRIISENQQLVQTLPLRGAKLLVVKNNNIFVAGTNTVWKLSPIPLAIQVEHLIQEGDYVEALGLSDHLPDSPETVKKKFKFFSFSQTIFKKRGQKEHILRSFMPTTYFLKDNMINLLLFLMNWIVIH